MYSRTFNRAYRKKNIIGIIISRDERERERERSRWIIEISRVRSRKDVVNRNRSLRTDIWRRLVGGWMLRRRLATICAWLQRLLVCYWNRNKLCCISESVAAFATISVGFSTIISVLQHFGWWYRSFCYFVNC